MSTSRCWPPATTIVLLTVQICLTILSYSERRRLAIDKLCEHNSDFIDFRVQCKSVGEFRACSVWKDWSKSFRLLQVEFKLCQLFVVLIRAFTYSSVSLSPLTISFNHCSLFALCLFAQAFSSCIPHLPGRRNHENPIRSFLGTLVRLCLLLHYVATFWMTEYSALR